MKKLIILILLTQLFWTNEIQSQCLQNGITFTTQAQINNFKTDYPGCTDILGDVTIQEGTSGYIVNLNGLNILNSIGGTLEIIGNEYLIDLSGLNNLDSVAGDLKISDCNSIYNLNGLQNLSLIGGGLILWFNESLSNIDSLEDLNSIGDYLIIGGHEMLSSLNGLGNIDSINELEIYQNDNLTNLIGLGNLSNIEGEVRIRSNDALINLSGLDSLSYIGGNVTIKNNDHITNLNGLENLTYVGGNMDIGTDFGGQHYFKSLTGLESLTTVGGYLSIAHNDSLNTIGSLNQLISTGYSLSVSSNYALTSIDSLLNLESIGGLAIGYNNLLQDISSLANVDTSSVSHVYITHNPLLANCHIESICEYISNPEAVTIISDNAPGCNSREEVEYACLVGVLPLSDNNKEISIYPNPTINKLNYSSSDFLILELNIYNQLGRKVLGEFHPKNTIDISSFTPGLYIVEFVTSKTRFKKKLIIE